jgi:hypothetical protein
VRTPDVNGIELHDNSDDNHILSDVVNDIVLDGLFVGGSGNHLDRNLLSNKGQWGTRLAGLANDNTYGRNTARRNADPPASSGFSSRKRGDEP